MVSGISGVSQSFLVAVNNIENRATKAQTELTTGLRVNTPSDDPSAVSNILWLQSRLRTVEQTNENLGRVQSEVSTAESALQNAVSVMDDVTTAGTEGASDTATTESRATLAESVQGKLEELVSLAGTTMEGRYIFHGDADSTAPYSVDLTQANGISTYDGAISTKTILDANDTALSYSKTAQEIFDSSTGGQSVFGAVNGLREALLADDTGAIQTAMDNLKTATSYLNSELGYYGVAYNQVTEAINVSSDLKTQYTSALSDLRDADVTAAALELTQTTTQLETAMSSKAKMPTTSLFNYLG
jgi:flagellar hook-associated protein 3 FlgL